MSKSRGLLTAVALIVAVYAMARVDLILRSRTAYLEGEKWAEHEDLDLPIVTTGPAPR